MFGILTSVRHQRFWSTRLIRGFETQTAAGFQSRRGFGHDPTPVTPHNALFAAPTYVSQSTKPEKNRDHYVVRVHRFGPRTLANANTKD